MSRADVQPRRATDAGSVTILTLGFAILAILLILVIAAATQLQLDRSRLTQLADESAIDAADAMDVPAYYAGTAERPTADAAIDLDESVMLDVVESHLNENAARCHLSDATVVAVSSPDGKTAVVTIAVVVQPLFGLEALLPWADGIRLTATSSARAR